MAYRVNEIFYSIQGEGARFGTPTVFVRFSRCNLVCGYCDTEFESGREMEAVEIAEAVAALMPEPRSVILTGGEPLMQYDAALEKALRSVGCFIACETNGSLKPKAGLDYVACSPKVAEHVLKANFPAGVNELRYIRAEAQAIPLPGIHAEHLFLSPMFEGGVLRKRHLDWCLNLAKQNPRWRLSVQMHKLLDAR